MKPLSRSRCHTDLSHTGEVVRYPNLLLRNGRYYIRRRVPADILPVWKGGKFVTKSLGTGDRRVALELLRVEQGNVQKEFDALRKDQAERSLRVSQVAQTGSYDLSDLEIDELVSAWREERLRRMEANARQPLSEEQARELAEEVDQDLACLACPGHEVVAQQLGSIVQKLLIRSGLPHTKFRGTIKLQAPDAGWSDTPVGKETSHKLFVAVREAEILLGKIHQAQLRGVPSSAPPIPVKTPPRAAYRLADLIRDFSNNPRRGHRTAKTDLDYGMVFRAMRDVIGAEKLVSEITREDCTKVRELFISLPRDATKKYPTKPLTEVSRKDVEAGLKTSTINSHLSKMSSVFAFAVIESHRSSSPAEKLQIPKTPKEEEENGRRNFSANELRAMFTAPLYTGCRDDGRNFWKAGPNYPRRSRFWVPLIALFSGLRQTEICQLTPSDIDVVDEIHVIHVRKTQGWQKLKTASAKRYVPLHPELIKIGLVQYAAVIRAQGEQQLFPEVKPDSRGYMGAVFQKQFNGFRHRVGIKDPDGVFHSFRHTWRDALREARLSDEMIQILGGWSGKGQDRRYGSQRFSPSTRFEDLSKISYPGLDLSPLYMTLTKP